MNKKSATEILAPSQDGQRYSLFSPVAMPKASGFLWNRKMMLQMTCRGYATAQFMQPEPSKYAHAPLVEGKTFMLPEQPYYVNHPGRFFYIKDEDTQEIFSMPYEPMRVALDKFEFSVGKADLQWNIQHLDLCVNLRVALPVDNVVELWELSLTNTSERVRNVSIYSYFPIGYMSWMNHGAAFNDSLQAIVATSVTAYQKLDDYFKNQHLKDLTFFACEQKPCAVEARQDAFEGEGGLHAPESLAQELLQGGDALYELPVAAVQYRRQFAPQEKQTFRFLFGPAFDQKEIVHLKEKFLSERGFNQAAEAFELYLSEGTGCVDIKTADADVDNFVNHWLPRQVFYHGDVNRLTTDPQTRNYLQDNMGMIYVKPQTARAAFCFALTQQEESGAMPDGILLAEGAEFKYINQIPHTDHCVWLSVFLHAYLDETNDYDLLNEIIVNSSTGQPHTVADCIHAAMRWLISARDSRGLSFIAQGDWCDPMNMVGYKGKGVSGWLTVATAYALSLWGNICRTQGYAESSEFLTTSTQINDVANQHLWDGDWYARGITDDNVAFGVAKDVEGRIYLNPQSWALMAGTASDEQQEKLIAAVEAQLETPYGTAMLAPAYTHMRDDVGRVTQKHPGAAENGSVYNHAAVFYIFSLLQVGEAEKAYQLFRQMLPGPSVEDYLQRGQLPVYIPNYYRGAFYQFPRTAGRSSQLFNTGTVSWVYRCLIEGFLGLKGCKEGLLIHPQFPAEWSDVSVERKFRGASVSVQYRRESIETLQVYCEGELQAEGCIRNIEKGKHYRVEVLLPK